MQSQQEQSQQEQTQTGPSTQPVKKEKNNYNKVMWTGDNQQAQTPPEVWKSLEAEFGEMFDPCPANPEVDGLSIPWKKINYVNPPYNECNAWMQKVVHEFVHGNKSVCLIPARSNTNWFHNWVLPYATEIRFIKNGVKFVGYKRKSPFPVCIVVYDPKKKGEQTFKSIDFYKKKLPIFKKRKFQDGGVPK